MENHSSFKIRSVEVDGESVVLSVSLPKLQAYSLIPLLGSLGDFGSLLRRKIKVASAVSSSRSDAFKAKKEKEYAALEARALSIFDSTLGSGSSIRGAVRAVASALGIKVGIAENVLRPHGRLSRRWKGQRIAHV